MNLLIISTDRQLFSSTSAVLKRQKKLLERYESLHIIVFTKGGFEKNNIDNKIFVYPTNATSKGFYIPDAVLLGMKICRKIKIEEIICQDPFETGAVGLILKWVFNSKLELQIHTDLGSPYFYQQNLLNKIRFWIARMILPYANKVRVVSGKIKSYVQNFVKEDKIYIQSIPIDKEKIINSSISFDLHQKYPQFRKIILMIDRLEPEKNVALGIKALAGLKDKSVGLVIVGDGSQRANLEKLAKTLDAGVVFEGQVTDVISYYKTADLFLHTSFYEGYGLVLMEAKIACLPIISTDVGIAREVGAQIISFNIEEIVNKIEDFIN